MQNILIIHEGQSFLDNETYLNYLQNLKIKSLGDKYNVISPNMPCKRI